LVPGTSGLGKGAAMLVEGDVEPLANESRERGAARTGLAAEGSVKAFGVERDFVMGARPVRLCMLEVAVGAGFLTEELRTDSGTGGGGIKFGSPVLDD
jgi:hypothetical protein